MVNFDWLTHLALNETRLPISPPNECSPHMSEFFPLGLRSGIPSMIPAFLQKANWIKFNRTKDDFTKSDTGAEERHNADAHVVKAAKNSVLPVSGHRSPGQGLVLRRVTRTHGAALQQERFSCGKQPKITQPWVLRNSHNSSKPLEYFVSPPDLIWRYKLKNRFQLSGDDRTQMTEN